MAPLIFETIYKRTFESSTQDDRHPSPLCTGTGKERRVSLAVLDLQAYLNHLASAEPTPGGGSAAAIVGALGAGLVAMVARITLGSSKHAAVAADALLLVGDADMLRAQLLAARAADEEAYAAVPRARALPRATDAERAERTTQLQAAFAGAAAAPLHLAELCAALVAQSKRAAGLRNTHLMSDVECALAFATAALEAAAANVRVNHRYLTDATLVGAQAARLDELFAAAALQAAAARERIDGS